MPRKFYCPHLVVRASQVPLALLANEAHTQLTSGSQIPALLHHDSARRPAGQSGPPSCTCLVGVGQWARQGGALVSLSRHLGHIVRSGRGAAWSSRNFAKLAAISRQAGRPAGSVPPMERYACEFRRTRERPYRALTACAAALSLVAPLPVCSPLPCACACVTLGHTSAQVRASVCVCKRFAGQLGCLDPTKFGDSLCFRWLRSIELLFSNCHHLALQKKSGK